ncbi:MAG: PadR family transcriptional regulator [Metallosphaera sp.]
MKMNLERLRRGVLRFLILDALNLRPMHVYEIMKTIETRFNGVYKPSPGSIYPVLKSLIKEGSVTVVEKDGKKVYKLTEDGEQKWAEAKAHVKHFFSNTNYRRLASELFDLSLVLYNYRSKLEKPEVFHDVDLVLMECRKKIEMILEDHNKEVS